MLLAKKIYLVCSILVLSISSVNAGEWLDLMLAHKEEAAIEKAKVKMNHYIQLESSIQLEKIANYVDNHLPDSTDIVRVGVPNFFDKKITKWAKRATNPFVCAIKILQKSNISNIDDMDYAEFVFGGERTSKILLNACKTSKNILFLKEVIKILEKTADHAKGQTKLADAPSSFVNDEERLIKTLTVSDKEVQRLQKVHTMLNNRIFELMDIVPDTLTLPFEGKSTVCVIEPNFKKYIQGEEGWDQPYGQEKKTFKWKKGDSPHQALPWNHGDMMAQLIKVSSPQSKVTRALPLVI